MLATSPRVERRITTVFRFARWSLEGTRTRKEGGPSEQKHESQYLRRRGKVPVVWSQGVGSSLMLLVYGRRILFRERKQFKLLIGVGKARVLQKARVRFCGKSQKTWVYCCTWSSHLSAAGKVGNCAWQQKSNQVQSCSDSFRRLSAPVCRGFSVTQSFIYMVLTNKWWKPIEFGRLSSAVKPK